MNALNHLKIILLSAFIWFMIPSIYAQTEVDICTTNSITICKGESIKLTCSEDINGAPCVNGTYEWEWYVNTGPDLFPDHESSGPKVFTPTESTTYDLEIVTTGFFNDEEHVTAQIVVTVLEGIEIEAIEFLSDHNLMHDGTDLFTVGNRFPDIEWQPNSTPAINAPMTHSISATDKIEIKVHLKNIDIPSGTNYTITGTSSESALNFSGTGTIPSTNNFELLIEGSNPIGEEIRKISESIDWNINITGTPICSKKQKTGPHTIYTTFDIPNTSSSCNGSVVNLPRIEEAYTEMSAAIMAAKTATSPHDCYTGYVYELNNVRKYFLGVSLDDCMIWSMNTQPRGADCFSISRYITNISFIYGIPGSFQADFFSAYYSTPSNLGRPLDANRGVTLNSPYIKPGDLGLLSSSGTSLSMILALADVNCVTTPPSTSGSVGCRGGLNAFEAAVIYTSNTGIDYYFPGGAPNNVFSNEDDVVRAIFQSLVWVGGVSVGTSTVLEVKVVDYQYYPYPVTNAILCP